MDAKLELHTRVVGSWGTNAYGLICPQSRASVLVDPGGDPAKLAEMLIDSQVVAIVLTHSHPDHAGTLGQMQQQYKVPIMAHPGISNTRPALRADRWLAAGDRIAVGRHRLRVWHTPGHCEDQICLALEEDTRTIVGDTIFEGGPGKTWTPAEFQTTLATLSDIILTWSDDTICYPGHGPSFRLGNRRADIEAFVRADHGDFFGDATWKM